MSAARPGADGRARRRSSAGMTGRTTSSTTFAPTIIASGIRGSRRSSPPAAEQAVRNTRGVFLVHGGEICDARYSKSCGGRSEVFASAWEDVSVPYLPTVSDAAVEHPLIGSEAAAESWMRSSPEAYCNTTDGNILRQVLPSFDQETTDFYRWTVTYTQEELAALLHKRSGIDFGEVHRLEPLQRGPVGAHRAAADCWVAADRRGREGTGDPALAQPVASVQQRLCCSDRGRHTRAFPRGSRCTARAGATGSGSARSARPSWPRRDSRRSRS